MYGQLAVTLQLECSPSVPALSIASSISVLKGLSGSLIRSFLSKILPIEDTAKLFALLNVLDACCPILAPIVYNTLYSSTITTFPGAFYMLSASIYSVCIVLLGFWPHPKVLKAAKRIPPNRLYGSEAAKYHHGPMPSSMLYTVVNSDPTENYS
ncbi:hypothetical protein MSG28_008609 [Choristoneura fumiferana]|uniref:Uncharacterized protein n=1 Tax=Choristoneura fumiferana TaxID=7141 RepID=A0ACC0J7D1_CHOFU|nr:hypothetical protein MSG28_008609 [Choristoneura fumiferana]